MRTALPARCAGIPGPVLSIAKLGRGQEGYYLSTVAAGVEDYYTGDGEAPGRWLGRGAERLRLDGRVGSGDLRAVLAGIDPLSGDQLSGRTGMRHVPGWDLTFSAPKSVSILYALAAPAVRDEVAAAHDLAVAEALAFLERHATISRRRVDGETVGIRGEGLVVAAFRHRTSRAGDPQLHTHCLAANLVERVDGGWGALHSPVVYRHGRTAGFVYQAVLRGDLTERLGVAWGPVRNGCAEVQGVDLGLRRLFSKRRTEIEAALAAQGMDSPAAAQVATLATRRAKDHTVDPETLWQRWRAEALRAGVDPDRVCEALHRSEPPRLTVGAVSGLTEALLAPTGLTADRASFERQDVVRGVCAGLPTGSSMTTQAIDAVADEVLGDPEVVAVVSPRALPSRGDVAYGADGDAATAGGSVARWSTRELLAVEGRLLARAAGARRSGAGQVSAAVVDGVLRERPELDDEQAHLVRALTTSGDGVQVAIGKAGTGKTFALAAAASVWRAGGYRPIGAALAARAAAELESGAGIPATTVAQLLTDLDRSGGRVIGPRDVIIVDEAAMVDTRRLARLASHALGVGAKLALVGDHHQLPAVEAGGAFVGLVNRLSAVELHENRRQVEGWERDALDRFRLGAGGRDGVAGVVLAYERHDRLHLATTPAALRARMVADWHDAREQGQTAAMVALRRSDVADLNARARALLVETGAVSQPEVSVAGRRFGVEDRVVCLHNDRRLNLHNALFGVVVGVDVDAGSIVIETERDGAVRRIPGQYLLDGNVDHAYATTIHKAQGATYDRILLLGDDRLYRQAGYTALSRGRMRNDLYVVDSSADLLGEDVEPHGPIEHGDARDRIVSAFHRDRAKHLATDDRAAARPPVQPLRPLADLWRERDRLAVRLAAGTPVDRSTALAAAGELVGEAAAAAATASAAREAAEERAASRRWVWRRAIATDGRHAVEREAASNARLDELVDEVDGLSVHEQARAAWAAAHVEPLTRLGQLDRTLRWRTASAGLAAELARPSKIVALLGEPPVGLNDRERWRAAAGAVESYCARWGVEALDDHPEAPTALQTMHRDRVLALVDSAASTRGLPVANDLSLE